MKLEAETSEIHSYDTNLSNDWKKNILESGPHVFLLEYNISKKSLVSSCGFMAIFRWFIIRFKFQSSITNTSTFSLKIFVVLGPSKRSEIVIDFEIVIDLYSCRLKNGQECCTQSQGQNGCEWKHTEANKIDTVEQA